MMENGKEVGRPTEMAECSKGLIFVKKREKEVSLDRRS